MFQVVQQYVDASAYGILLPLVSGHRGLDQDLPWILLHLQFLRQILPPFVDGNIFEPEKRGLCLQRIAWEIKIVVIYYNWLYGNIFNFHIFIYI